jgi:Zn-dependent protease
MLFALSAHEASHAGAAYLLGDDTAYRMGRFTLNPFKHLDPFGVLAFFVIHFGWAKPVPVNHLKLRNPRADMLFIGLAGPVCNLFLGVVMLFAIRILWSVAGPSTEATRNVLAFLFVGAQLNVGLCFFNLIPFPPLDGSHVLSGVLPEGWADWLDGLKYQGIFGLVALFVFIRFLGGVIRVPMDLVITGMLGPEIAARIWEVMRMFQLF